MNGKGVSEMSIRMSYADFKKRAAEVNAAMAALGAAVDSTGLAKELTELIKIRASQINRCGFCFALHRDVASRLGVPDAKLRELEGWRGSNVFSPREKAALAWTELLTARPDAGVTPEDHAALLEHFTEDEAVYLNVTVGAINQWNRIALGLGFTETVTAKL